MSDLSMTEVSRAVFMSVRQLQRKFKQRLGIRPHEFLIQTRVLAACRLLQETNDSLTEVALACGFFDQSALGRHFRKHVGMTPARFRSHSLSEAPPRNGVRLSLLAGGAADNPSGGHASNQPAASGQLLTA